MKRISFDELYKMYMEGSLQDSVEALEILKKDYAGYIREAKDINQLVKMLNPEEKLILLDQLRNRGAKLGIDEILREIAPEHAYAYSDEFIHYGADIETLADKILEDDDMDIVFEQEKVEELLAAGANPKRLLLNVSSDLKGEFEDALDDFLEVFELYMGKDFLEQFKKELGY